MTAGEKNQPTESRHLASWLKQHLQDGDAEKVKQALIEAEKKTKGDIVPMVVHRSSNLSYVAPTLFLLLLLAFLLAGTKYVVEDSDQSFHLFALAAALVSLILALILSRLEFLQRMIIPKATQSYDVHQRAELEFYRNHFDQTKSHGAVLIFISLFERKVVVLCDDFLNQKLSQGHWDSITEVVSAHMRSADLLQGLLDAISLTGELLAKVLPDDGGQSHEISTDFRVQE